MKIVSLMDNVAASDAYVSRHGLSFYIETEGRRILFDAGPDESFLENAEKLGIDLSKVDFAVLSHGHYDHGGGLMAFCRVNDRAPIYMQAQALDPYYARDPDKIRYIGLSDELRHSSRVRLYSGDVQLGNGIQLFSGVTERKLYSPGNAALFMECGGEQVPDLFVHEQNLLLTERGHSVLVAGCAHSGMVNILGKAQTLAETPITHVFGGMHLKGTSDRKAFARTLAGRLKQENCVFYTCHCTSVEGYETMAEVMGRQIHYLAAGETVVC